MTDAPTQAAGPTALAPQILIRAQYVKDLSFENPSAPDVFRNNRQAPQIDFGVDVGVRRLTEDTFEVSLHMDAKAQQDATVVFLIELHYAGVFQLQNIPADQVEPILLVECPRMLFPFARRIVADVTRDGNFPPLAVDPIDFATLYRTQKARAASAAPPPSLDAATAH